MFRAKKVAAAGDFSNGSFSFVMIFDKWDVCVALCSSFVNLHWQRLYYRYKTDKALLHYFSIRLQNNDGP